MPPPPLFFPLKTLLFPPPFFLLLPHLALNRVKPVFSPLLFLGVLFAPPFRNARLGPSDKSLKKTKTKTKKEKGLSYSSARAISKNASGTCMAVMGFGNTISIDVWGKRRIGERTFYCYLSAAEGRL